MVIKGTFLGKTVVDNTAKVVGCKSKNNHKNIELLYSKVEDYTEAAMEAQYEGYKAEAHKYKALAEKCRREAMRLTV